MFKSKRKNYLIVFVLVLFVVIAAIVYYTRYQADTNQVTFSGHVYEGLEGSSSQQQSGPPAIGASVYLICPSSGSSCSGTKEYTATVDSVGYFSITITSPSTCPYRVLVGGGKYGFRDRGSVTFGGNQVGSGMMANQPQIMTVDTETDMMQSSYPGLDGMYTSGYQGAYHFSQYDSYYLRNLVKKDQLLNPKTPTGAKVSINIIQVRPGLSMNLMPGSTPVPIPGLPILATIEVHPVLGNWVSGTSQSIGPVVGSMDISIDQNFKPQKFDFAMDLSALTQEQRYQSWLNGFYFSFRFKGGANISDMSNLALVQRWSQINPDLLIARSEDGVVTNVEYSGLTNYARNNSSGFVGPVHSPVDSIRVTDVFGPGIHPLTHKPRLHRGIDLGGSSGVYAYNAGKVAVVGRDSAYGLNIRIDHCNGYSTYYNHLAEGSVLVTAGDTVTAGQHIATVDSTGSSTGYHLHFDISINGTFVNPWPYIKDL